MRFPCGCKEEAVCEKAGRTVCRRCADHLRGREFPLRTGRDASVNDLEKQALFGSASGHYRSSVRFGRVYGTRELYT
jgi:hypothetical protein